MKKNYLKCLSLFALATTLILTGVGCSNTSPNSTTTPSQSTSDENINNSLNNSSNDSTLQEPSKDNLDTNSSSKEDSENTINNEHLKLFNMTLDNSNFIYGLNDEYAQFKISESDNIMSIRYLNNLDSYITLESSNSDTIYDMYLINSSNEKILISNNMTKDNFKYFTLESKGNLYYLTSNNNLYCYNQENNKESKVESNVYKFDITSNGEIVINTNDTLYIINTKGNKTVLSSHGKCGAYYIDNNKVIYLEDTCICYYDMSKNYSEIIEETDIISYNTDYSISFNDNGFLYYINYTYETIDNALKYKTYNGDTITIDSNIENYALAEDGVYYTKYTEEFIDHNNYIESTVFDDDYLATHTYQGDMYDGIYYFDFLSNKSTKISEYNKLIETTNINSPMAYILDDNDNVSMISNDGTIKQNYGTINQGYEIYEDGENSYILYVPYTPVVFKDYTVILSTNGELYFNDSVIASNVDFILSSGDNLAYITKDNKIYLIDENEEIQLIVDDATKYNKVFFNGDLLYID